MATIPLKDITFPGLDNTYTIPEIDNTLSTAGKAADAKKTGDEIDQLKSDYSDLRESTEFLIGSKHNNYELTWNSGGYVNNVGTITANVNNYYTDAVLLADDAGVIPETITFKKYNTTDWINYCFYDSADTFIRFGTVEAVTSATVNVPSGASKIRFSTNKNTYMYATLTGNNESIIARLNELSSEIDVFNQGVVVLTKSGTAIQVRSEWESEHDMSIRANLFGSENKAFCFTNYYLDDKNTEPSVITGGTVWKSAGDDITPIRFDYSYMGGGHGNDRGYILTFASNHGLTESNIGEIWTDANSNQLLICKIISTTKILCCCPNGSVSTQAPFQVITPTSPISHNGVSKAFSSFERGQFAPMANHISVKVYADEKEISDDGVYYADHIDVVESYDLIFLPSMVDYLVANVGDNTNESYYSDDITDRYCTVNNVYRFTERGAITLIQSVDWSKTVNLDYIGMVQSGKIGNYYALPLTNAYMLTDYNNTYINFDPSMWKDSNVPPNRYYQYFDTAMTKGIVLGYNTEIGTGKPSERKSSSTVGFIQDTSGKLYPLILKKSANTDTMISCVAYRVPLNKYSNDVPSVGWYYFGDDIYLLINAQSSADSYITLPDKMIGRKITIVETDGSIELPYEVVGAKGIKIKTTNYGSAILKLSK